MDAPDVHRERRTPEPTEPRDERKERVLHTRVPESLDRQIRRRARRLGMSVSTVVRHILSNTFGLVEDIVADSTNVALAMTGEDDGTASSSHVLGWQEAILAVNAVCERCNAVLERGSRAAIGVRERPGPRAIRCRRCVRHLTAEGAARRSR